MKKLYAVCLTRDITESAVVEVEAENVDDAVDLAVNMAGEVYFQDDVPRLGVYVSCVEEVDA